jgi:hypothetical protein
LICQNWCLEGVACPRPQVLTRGNVLATFGLFFEHVILVVLLQLKIYMTFF